MRKRFKLIWLALVAPIDTVEAKSNKLLNAVNNIYVEGVQKRLDALNESSWKLTGVSIEHYGSADIDAIESFLRRSPEIIRNLITIIKQ